jgi:hypothetical protein
VTSLRDFIAARLDEDEAAALAAVDPECPGTHWQWVTTETDTPVAHGDLDEAQEHQKVALRTVEHVDYPPETGYGSLPGFLIVYTEEVHAGAGEHIIRHDPARVLREVGAGRHILKAHPIDTEYDQVAACRACQWDVDCGAPRDDLEPSDCPCPTLRNLAWTWHTEQGWDMAWCPHHEEDHTEVDHEGPFRAFKRTCRHCQADLGKLLKPRLDGD